MNPISIADINLINEISRVMSFTEAGENLSLPRSTVTRRVKTLEEYLGVSLFYRSTRRLSLTLEGERFLKHAKQIELEWNQASEKMKLTSSVPSGKLRVSALSLFNRVICREPLSNFMSKYPQIELEISSTSAAPDLNMANIDLMLNTRQIDNKGYIHEAIAFSEKRFYASPEYLSKMGVPQTPEQLLDHKLILVKHPNSANDIWRWQEQGVDREIKVSSNLKIDQIDCAIEMMLLGNGICWLPEFSCKQYVKEGKLKRILPHVSCSKGTLWAIYPKNPYDSQRLRLFIDMIKESGLFGEAPIIR
ncbi:LysR family transcriptional regulator [Shewanella maritima]|uniref:LysR family transcriptional regulator n=1 Tax=Shewanella maritima TaxID=2520507 RepID=UPI0037364023